MKLKPIGFIHTPFQQAAGTPIQPSMAEGVQGTVELWPQYAAGLKDLDGFDRIWLLYWFHRAAKPKLIVRPYMDENEHGVFATRAPSRPNPIGMSSVRLLAVEGNILRIADVDILDGTPLLDIKPYAPLFDHFPVTRSGWLETRQKPAALADRRFERP